MGFGQFMALGVTWGEFWKRATENAGADFEALVPVLVRDGNRVVQYVELRAPKSGKGKVALPMGVGPALVWPGLWERFEPVLGQRILVVVASQGCAFLFPGGDRSHERYAAAVLKEYYGGARPVSLEVFEVNGTGWRAVGALEE